MKFNSSMKWLKLSTLTSYFTPRRMEMKRSSVRNKKHELLTMEKIQRKLLYLIPTTLSCNYCKVKILTDTHHINICGFFERLVE